MSGNDDKFLVTISKIVNFSRRTKTDYFKTDWANSYHKKRSQQNQTLWKSIRPISLLETALNY